MKYKFNILFRLQGYTEVNVPTHKQIQECLVKIGDKPASFVGSCKWIGSTEVSFVLETLLGVSCRILTASSGEEVGSLGSELSYHFQTHGTPIMIGSLSSPLCNTSFHNFILSYFKKQLIYRWRCSCPYHYWRGLQSVYW